jgi:hypothetical protein
MSHRAGDAQNIGVTWTALQVNTELLNVVTRRNARYQFNVTTVAAAGIHMEEPRTLLAAATQELFK